MSGKVQVLFRQSRGPVLRWCTGTLRALGVTSADRWPLVCPDVPAIAGDRCPGYEIYVWYALFAPRSHAGDIVTKLNCRPQGRGRGPKSWPASDDDGGVPMVMTPGAPLAQFSRRRRARWRKISRCRGHRSPNDDPALKATTPSPAPRRRRDRVSLMQRQPELFTPGPHRTISNLIVCVNSADV